MLALSFEEHRPRMRSVAYRMLGSLAEADDAVQEAWLRLSRVDAGAIDNLAAWLTTVVGRISLNMLRSRHSRREESLDVHVPDPIIDRLDAANPEHEAIAGESLGLAALMVLETLNPAERVAFVLHDMFAVPYEEIAPIIDRTPVAARQLASRARRRVQSGSPATNADRTTQREVVEAFVSAARNGDLETLVRVLDPEIVLRVDGGPGVSREVRGAAAVSRQATAFTQMDIVVEPALINGFVGAISFRNGQLFSVTDFTIRDGAITAMTILADPERLQRLGVSGSGAE